MYGLAAGLGRPYNAFVHTPPQKVVQDFFGRRFKPSTAAPPVFSPLPEPVMIGTASSFLVLSSYSAPPVLTGFLA